MKKLQYLLACLWVVLSFSACKKDDDDNNHNNANGAVFLLIDEESIDNGNQPNNFSDTAVNDQLATVGLRATLEYFKNNVGQTITLYTGQVGDEGWLAPKTIPDAWKTTGPTNNGTKNFFTPGPGLGASGSVDKEQYLDNIPDVTPLRATALAMLTGKTVYAVVYDSDIAVNYSPLKASLKGDNLGVVAFDVLNVTARTDGSSSSLPAVSIKIRSVSEVAALTPQLFSNAPVPSSSSEPFDITPPTTIPTATLVAAP